MNQDEELGGLGMHKLGEGEATEGQYPSKGHIDETTTTSTERRAPPDVAEREEVHHNGKGIRISDGKAIKDN